MIRDVTKHKDEIRQYLESLERDGRRITPDDVIEAAKDPESPLHHMFEWDDEKAALENRRYTARVIIKTVEYRVTVRHMTIASVAYVRDPEAAGNQQGYRHVAAIRTEKDLAHEVLVAEFGRAAAALRRARDLAAIFELGDEVDGIMQTLQRLQDRMMQAPPLM